MNDKPKKNNQVSNVDTSNSNSNDTNKIRWLIIGAVIASIPTLINSHINNLAEDKRITTQAKVARQDADIKRSLSEIDNLIDNYNKFKLETNVILKNLSKSNAINLEDFYSPNFNVENFNLTDKVIIEKISSLHSNLIPPLRDSYNRLTTTYKVPLPVDIIATINGVDVIATIWCSHKNSPPIKFSSIAPNLVLWVPQEELDIPPNQSDGIKIYDAYMNKINEQINLLPDIRMRVRDGEFQ